MTVELCYNHWFLLLYLYFFFSHTSHMYRVLYLQMVLNAVTSPEFDISNFPPYLHVPTYQVKLFTLREHWLLSCIIALDRNRLAMALLTLSDVLMHHRTLAVYSVQQAAIELSGFQLCFCQTALITKRLTYFCEYTSESFRNRTMSLGSVQDSEMR